MVRKMFLTSSRSVNVMKGRLVSLRAASTIANQTLENSMMRDVHGTAHGKVIYVFVRRSNTRLPCYMSLYLNNRKTGETTPCFGAQEIRSFVQEQKHAKCCEFL